MVSEKEVRAFLKEFKEKMKIWGVYFLDGRGKNAQALLDLEIKPVDRNKIVSELTFTDYSQGPLEETFHGGSSMWVFGKQVKGKEIYIKLTIGVAGRQVICISFHVAEHPMDYPLKN